MLWSPKTPAGGKGLGGEGWECEEERGWECVDGVGAVEGVPWLEWCSAGEAM